MTVTGRKKIGIDARLYFQTGVGVYVRNLLHYLQLLDTSKFEFFIYILEKDKNNIKFLQPNFHLRVVNSKWHTLSEQVVFLAELYKDNLDLMHFTYFSHPILYKRPCIATIHDTILLQLKTGKASTQNSLLYELKHKAFSLALSSQVKHARQIITPTNEIKKQLISIYGEKYVKKIQPLYEGVNFELVDAEESPKLAYNPEKPFFIYVGNFYPHKNVESLIEAFKDVDPTYELILIGPDDFFSKRIVELVHTRGLQERVIFKHNISNQELKWYYKHALALIHPSRSEGFGLPLIEASYFKCPVIASDIAVFKELLGTAYWSFNPESIGDITKKIKDFIKDKAGHTLKEQKNPLHAYSFEKMTQEILSLYEKNSYRL